MPRRQSSSRQTLSATPARPPDLRLWAIAIVVLVGLGALAYWNSLHGAFYLDDQLSIVDNPDIRRVWSLDALRSASGESAVLGRPLVTLSFALNYAIGGLDTTGYHVVNVAIHILCALILFGLIHRLRQSIPFAFACASLWLVHPLNTEAVNYLSQRTELLMGLFYLLTIYAAVRAHAAKRPMPWLAVAVVSSVLGTASKQSMATVPLAVVLIDRVFFFGSLAEAFGRRWRFYAAVTAGMLITLTATVLVSPQAHSVGLATGLSSWTYLLNQSRIITHYLVLAAWPRGLVADYGVARLITLADVLPYFLFVGALFILSCAVLWHRPLLGVPGAWFFLTLAVTSSLAPIATEVGAERRMYLPLAGLVVLAAWLVAWLADRMTRPWRAGHSQMAAAVCAGIWAAAAVSLTAGTLSRNREYSSALELAQTNVDRWPSGNAHHVLAIELLKAGRRDEAIAHLRQAALDDSRARFTLGAELLRNDQRDEARTQLLEFLRAHPLLAEAVDAHAMLGRIYLAEGRLDAADEQFSLAASMQPSFADAHLGLGEVRRLQGRFADAVPEYRAYLGAKPAEDGVWLNLGLSLEHLGRIDDAIACLRRATAINARSAPARRSLAGALLQKGDVDAAVSEARMAVALRGGDPLSHDLLGAALADQGQFAAAIAEFQEALRLSPGDAEIQSHLAQAEAAGHRSGTR